MSAAPQRSPSAEALVEPFGVPARPSLDDVDAPAAAADVTLTSGRRYELSAGADADRLTIRSRSGEIVLRIEVGDAGPVLSFTGGSVELLATKRLVLKADEVSLEARGDLSLAAGGSMRQEVAGDHHTRVAGDERVEAANVELQASTGGVAVRAMERIALDGEHIGLNDEPLPQPFAWSEPGREMGLAPEPEPGKR